MPNITEREGEGEDDPKISQVKIGSTAENLRRSILRSMAGLQLGTERQWLRSGRTDRPEGFPAPPADEPLRGCGGDGGSSRRYRNGGSP
jgi:hypothetical protein